MPPSAAEARGYFFSKPAIQLTTTVMLLGAAAPTGTTWMKRWKSEVALQRYFDTFAVAARRATV